MNLLYADGGLISGKNPSIYGGTWAFRHVKRKPEGDIILSEMSGLVLPGHLGIYAIENNLSEFYALLMAIEGVDAGWSGIIHSDSKNTLYRFFGDYAMNNVPLTLQDRMRKAVRRLGETSFVLLDGHPTKKQLQDGVGKRGNPVSIHNKWCDEACTKEAKRYLEFRADLKIVQGGAVGELFS